MQHIFILNGQLVRKPKSTLVQAAEEYAALHSGHMIFACPNYAVVATHSRKEGSAVFPSKDSQEVTIWMR